MYNRNSGFTLVEIIVVMGIFLTVIMITGSAFKTIANQSIQQTKSAESQIEGIVGLELLRADLEQAGFGLPWELNDKDNGFDLKYEEVVAGSTSPASFWPSGKSPESFNDGQGTSTPANPPRAILSDNTTFNWDGSLNIGSKYIVVKSTVAATNSASKRWTTRNIKEDGSPRRMSWEDPGRNLKDGDRVIVVKNNLMSDPPTRQLMATAATTFSSTFGVYSTLITKYQNGDTFQIYGIDPDTNPKMPFNRAEFYIHRPDDKVPKSCAESPGVGILYKSVISQDNGTLSIGMPLLDCVADMQIVYGLDTSGSGRVNQYSDAPAATASPTAADIRSQLREIRVYILAQDGQRDLSYRYPSETVLVGEVLNGIQRGRLFNFNAMIGPMYKFYRWKVYTIVVRPKNLIQ